MAKKKRKSKPLVPPPLMKSRKKARVVTTLFHKYTRELDLAKERGDETQVQHYEQQIQEMGGRQEYQRASQLSTSFHSTSKWVLGHMARSGWLYGIPTGDKKDRRKSRVLEIGAINTEMLDAAKETKTKKQPNGTVQDLQKYRIDVRAIDLNSMHPGIETADFLTFPIADPKYDVLVCSMVINCVTKPEQRGLMLARLYHQLRPEGLCFLTLPRLCLNLSPSTTMDSFKQMLSDGGVGFQIQQTKESPKVAFFVLRRPPSDTNRAPFQKKWTKIITFNRGKKFKNTFAVTLKESEVNGRFG